MPGPATAYLDDLETLPSPSHSPMPAASAPPASVDEQPTLPTPPSRVPAQQGPPLDPSLLRLQPGTRLGDRWSIGRRLGAGGTSVVFAAEDLELGRWVALKVLAADPTRGQLLERFHRELAIARRLEHPNIVRMFGEGQVDGLRWLSMELLTGVDLKQHLARGPLSLTETMRLLLHACAALGHAHAHGVLHRDVKPANLFLTRTHLLKLTDFGHARPTGTSALTQAGLLVGTPEFMSPEQVTADRPLTPACDLYALGVVAYQMLTGTTPFRHPQVLPLLMMHLRERPRPLVERRPDVPPGLAALVHRMLEKDPAARPPSADAIRAELRTLWPEVHAREVPRLRALGGSAA